MRPTDSQLATIAQALEDRAVYLAEPLTANDYEGTELEAAVREVNDALAWVKFEQARRADPARLPRR